MVLQKTIVRLLSVLILLGAQNPLLRAQSTPVAPQITQQAQPVNTTSSRGGADMASSAGISPGTVNGDYVLQVGDTIAMIVFREPELNIVSKIGNDGIVQLPLLGDVKIAGLNVRTANALITKKYNADYLVNPEIYLNIAAYNIRKFTVIGEVAKPGTYDYTGSEALDLLEAIGMAGGFTRTADRGHVVVKRRKGNVMESIKINANKLAKSGTDQFEILAGDIISVAESWY